MRKNPGFSLIELMIVMAILSALGIFVLPTMIQARHMAYLNVCITNIKNISVAIEAFSADNIDKIPTAEDVETLTNIYIGKLTYCPIRRDYYLYNYSENDLNYIIFCPTGDSLSQGDTIYFEPFLKNKLGQLSLDPSSAIKLKSPAWGELRSNSNYHLAGNNSSKKIIPVLSTKLGSIGYAEAK